MKNNNLMFLDIETTGLSPKKNEIIELSLSIFHNGVRCIDTTLYMRPEKWDTISDQALAVNGYTIEKLRTLPNKKYAWANLRSIAFCYSMQFKEKLNVVEHNRNNNFDFKFLEEFWGFFPKAPPLFRQLFNSEVINTRDIAKKKFPKLKSYRLVEIAKHLKIPVDERKLHGAHYDKELLIEVYRRLTGGIS